MQSWFFVLMAVGDQPSNQMHDTMDRAALARMLDLRNSLELINDGLDTDSFAHQQCVGKVHETGFHVFPQSGNEMESLLKEHLRERSRNVAAISEHLPAPSFHEGRNRSPIIDIAWGETASQQIAAIIDRQVQLEAKEPAHATFATPGISGTDAVLADAFGMTHVQGS